MINDIVLKTSEAANYIASKINSKPKVAIILCDGLEGLEYEVKEERVEISYQEIPNFPKTKSEMDNKLIFGKIYDKDVVIIAEKFYYYDGYDMDEITFPIRVLALLGVETMIISSTSGAISKELKVDDIMIIKDHIKLCAESPLRGHGESEFETLQPSMFDAYSNELIQLAKEAASFKNIDDLSDKSFFKKFKDTSDLKIDLKEGVYAFMPGPQFETKSEIKLLSVLGADTVGMSVVPEVIMARSLGIQVLGISHITNQAGCVNSSNMQDSDTNEIGDKIINLIMRIIMKM